MAPLIACGWVGAQLSPESAEEYIEYLKSSDRLDEAAQRLATVVNDERFVSKAGKSNYQVGPGWWRQPGRRARPLEATADAPSCAPQLWHELCDLISQNPDKVQSLNVDAIIRGGLTRFTDQLGKLWCSLADYYIRSGHFEKVRGWEGGRGLGGGRGQTRSPSGAQHHGTPMDAYVSRKHVQMRHLCMCACAAPTCPPESGERQAVWPWRQAHRSWLSQTWDLWLWLWTHRSLGVLICKMSMTVAPSPIGIQALGV